MTKQELQKIHDDLMKLGEMAFEDRDDQGVLVLGPVIGWLYKKIEEYPHETTDATEVPDDTDR